MSKELDPTDIQDRKPQTWQDPTNRGSFLEMAEIPPDEVVPFLDRSDIGDVALSDHQKAWRETGTVYLPRFLPEDLIDAYSEVRTALGQPEGWHSPSPYEHVPEMRALALYPPLMAVMKEVIGEDMLLHLALTGWVSTERNWHQDDYLNPPDVNSWYTAVWMALDDIHEDAGPFQYIPGSHRWPVLRSHLVQARMTEEELTDLSSWPWTSEKFVVPATLDEIARRDQPIQPFMAKRGDVLVWHGRLMHRGSPPNVPGMQRKSLICHYSGINHRADMPERTQDENGQWYAVFGTPLS